MEQYGMTSSVHCREAVQEEGLEKGQSSVSAACLTLGGLLWPLVSMAAALDLYAGDFQHAQMNLQSVMFWAHITVLSVPAVWAFSTAGATSCVQSA
jgi:hypothetical protein